MPLLRSMALVGAALLFFAGCSTQQVADVALSKDPKAALRNLGQRKVESYKRNPEQLAADFDRIQAELARLFGQLRQDSEKKWGKEEAQTLPGPKRYVKYTDQYKNRVIVDYERSTMRVEHIQDPLATEKLRQAIVVLLLTPEDPKSADVFSDKEVVLEGKPFLQDLVLDHNRQSMTTRGDVERFAVYLTENRLQRRRISVNGASVEVIYVQIDMIGAEEDRIATATPPKREAAKPPKKAPPTARKPQPDTRSQSPAERVPERPSGPPPEYDHGPDPNGYAAADKIAPKYLAVVNKYAAATGVDPALVFGVMYQESRFNPHAVSSAGAIGIMQLVPKSGGLEAFRKAKGESVQPTREYLTLAENNIELGATYLGILLFDYWMKGVVDAPSRDYLAISGYNTGPGNVARAFTGSTSKVAEAQQKANDMQTEDVFRHLRGNLPYVETRDYLLRVAAAQRHYKTLFYSGD